MHSWLLKKNSIIKACILVPEKNSVANRYFTPVSLTHIVACIACISTVEPLTLAMSIFSGIFSGWWRWHGAPEQLEDGACNQNAVLSNVAYLKYWPPKIFES
jgi:hypothetical protein